MTRNKLILAAAVAAAGYGIYQAVRLYVYRKAAKQKLAEAEETVGNLVGDLADRLRGSDDPAPTSGGPVAAPADSTGAKDQGGW